MNDFVWIQNSFLTKLFLQVARNEFLSLLSMMVRGCEHESWSDLTVLLNDDPEKDFFENMKHIQVSKFHVDYFFSLYFFSLFFALELRGIRGEKKELSVGQSCEMYVIVDRYHTLWNSAFIGFFKTFDGLIANHKIWVRLWDVMKVSFRCP